MKNKALASQSLWNRAVSYDDLKTFIFDEEQAVSIPLEQGSVLRQDLKTSTMHKIVSQSLWNRAVSYDNRNGFVFGYSNNVSIPLEQGSVLRR